jgi:hypothetical protein
VVAAPGAASCAGLPANGVIAVSKEAAVDGVWLTAAAHATASHGSGASGERDVQRSWRAWAFLHLDCKRPRPADGSILGGLKVRRMRCDRPSQFCQPRSQPMIAS